FLRPFWSRDHGNARARGAAWRTYGNSVRTSGNPRSSNFAVSGNTVMRTVRILIADDHAIVRRGLRALVESQQGWEVCAEAANGRQAVESGERFKPDIAIVDIGMPELNGLEATRQILKMSPRTEVLVLTMHQSEEVVAVLNVSTRTIETHRANIMHKLGINSLSGLVRYAIRNKIVHA